MHTKWK